MIFSWLFMGLSVLSVLLGLLGLLGPGGTTRPNFSRAAPGCRRRGRRIRLSFVQLPCLELVQAPWSLNWRWRQVSASLRKTHISDVFCVFMLSWIQNVSFLMSLSSSQKGNVSSWLTLRTWMTDRLNRRESDETRNWRDKISGTNHSSVMPPQKSTWDEAQGNYIIYILQH